MKPLSKAQNVTLKSANRSLGTESDITSSHNNFAHSRTMRRLRASFGGMVCAIPPMPKHWSCCVRSCNNSFRNKYGMQYYRIRKDKEKTIQDLHCNVKLECHRAPKHPHVLNISKVETRKAATVCFQFSHDQRSLSSCHSCFFLKFSRRFSSPASPKRIFTIPHEAQFVPRIHLVTELRKPI